MNYECFIKKCWEIAEKSESGYQFSQSKRREEGGRWEKKQNCFYWDSCSQFCEPSEETREILYVDWAVGSSSGASCWDNAPSVYEDYDDVKPKELTLLYEILESLCPQMTLLAGRDLINSVLEYDTYDSDHDYYGNYTSYGCYTVKLPNLFQELIKIGCL